MSQLAIYLAGDSSIVSISLDPCLHLWHRVSLGASFMLSLIGDLLVDRVCNLNCYVSKSVSIAVFYKVYRLVMRAWGLSRVLFSLGIETIVTIHMRARTREIFFPFGPDQAPRFPLPFLHRPPSSIQSQIAISSLEGNLLLFLASCPFAPDCVLSCVPLRQLGHVLFISCLYYSLSTLLWVLGRQSWSSCGQVVLGAWNCRNQNGVTFLCLFAELFEKMGVTVWS